MLRHYENGKFHVTPRSTVHPPSPVSVSVFICIQMQNSIPICFHPEDVNLMLMSQPLLTIKGSKNVTLIFTNLIRELQKLIRNFYSPLHQGWFVFFSHLWCITSLFLSSLPNFPFLRNTLFLSHPRIPFSFQNNVFVTELLPLNFIFTSQWTPQHKGTSS